jgi:hypothetical protein
MNSRMCCRGLQKSPSGLKQAQNDSKTDQEVPKMAPRPCREVPKRCQRGAKTGPTQTGASKIAPRSAFAREREPHENLKTSRSVQGKWLLDRLRGSSNGLPSAGEWRNRAHIGHTSYNKMCSCGHRLPSWVPGPCRLRGVCRSLPDPLHALHIDRGSACSPES